MAEKDGEELETMSLEKLETELSKYEQMALEYLQMYMEYRHFQDRELLKDQITACEQVVAAIKHELEKRSA